MSKRTCSIPGCEKQHEARGLCRPHYGRARREGQLPPVQLSIPTRPSHSLSNIDREAATATCSVCGPRTPIRVGKPGLGGRKARGSECQIKREADQVFRGLTPEARREAKLRKKYGITGAEYNAMREEQEGSCLICRGRPDVLVVDHCHKTGRVRGLLCASCNTALGYLYDSPEVASAAAEYLLRS